MPESEPNHAIARRDALPSGDAAIARLADAVTTSVASRSLDSIAEVAARIVQVQTIAKILCAAKILPTALQNEANLTLVILQGVEMGFTPIQAIRATYAFPGEGGEIKIGYWSDALVALVRASPVCRRFEVIDLDEARCSIEVERKDWPEGHKRTYALTRGEVSKRNGDKRYDKQSQSWKNKATWMSSPDDMLRNRTQTKAVKAAFQDVIFGMYTREELEELQERDEDDRVAMPAMPAFRPIDVTAVAAPDRTATTDRGDAATHGAALAEHVRDRMPGWAETATERGPVDDSPFGDEPAAIVEAEEMPSPRFLAALTAYARASKSTRLTGDAVAGLTVEAITTLVIDEFEATLSVCGTMATLRPLSPMIAIWRAQAGTDKACGAMADRLAGLYNERAAAPDVAKTGRDARKA
jgi:hypothetical protein